MNRVGIHCVPRSGSSWLSEIFNSSKKTIYKHQPLFSYQFKGRISNSSTGNDIDKFFEELMDSKDKYIHRIDERNSGSCPIFNKSNEPNIIVYKEVRYHHILKNLLKKDPNIKIIGLVRNPLSVINSWLRAPREFRMDLGWNELDEWKNAPKKNMNKIEEFNGFNKWKEVTLLFEELQMSYPDRFYLLRYDNLLKNTEEVIGHLFNQLNLEYSIQTQEFISKSSHTDKSYKVYSVYRNNQVDDKWKLQLNPIIINEIEDSLKNSKLRKYLQ